MTVTRLALDRLQCRQVDEDVLNTHEYSELIPLLAKDILAIVKRKLAAGAYTATGLVVNEADVV